MFPVPVVHASPCVADALGFPRDRDVVLRRDGSTGCVSLSAWAAVPDCFPLHIPTNLNLHVKNSQVSNWRSSTLRRCAVLCVRECKQEGERGTQVRVRGGFYCVELSAFLCGSQLGRRGKPPIEVKSVVVRDCS